MFESIGHGSCVRDFVEKKTRRQLKGLVDISLQRDPMGNKHYVITLTDQGRAFADFLKRKYGYNEGPKRGIVLESTHWHVPSRTSYKVQDILEAWRSLSKKAGVPVRIKRDWRPHQHRVISPDFDDLIVNLEMHTQWSSHRGDLDRLQVELGFSETESWLWGVYLDQPELRASIRKLAQPYFVVWDHLSETETSPES